ncbi:VRR-NUC domain-containing protein [Aidingimonas lacisalsi]|uniref:VRR-NUC domain-containing protein n=1 Tax=Aidingimonas lacisalsi TaxID=2604086 RepID=UPI0011D2621E|nr:VRR-NUC domain-containing protein [Aidingimonas lacisalsi]
MNSTSRSIPVTAPLDDPFYYLRNFQFVLEWVTERYDDLLSDDEEALIETFHGLPRMSQALMVRMVMRKGCYFRTSKLRYAEIGDPCESLFPLAEAGLVVVDPELTVDTLLPLMTLTELRRALASYISETGLSVHASKRDLSAGLQAVSCETRRWSSWWPQAPDAVVMLCNEALFERLRLMFFGNLRQHWSEFVLTELGIQRFETVALPDESRAFQERADIDLYRELHDLRERLDAGEGPAELFASLPVGPFANAWLESRRSRLAFQIAREAERQGDTTTAMAIYPRCQHVEARVRQLRQLERRGECEVAYRIATRAMESPRNEAEIQHLERILPRLCRRLGMASPPQCSRVDDTTGKLESFALRLPATDGVELAVRDRLARDEAPVYYVENTLLTGVFGLLCWEAIFAPLPGAFFHPFHVGPADLYREDFVTRRQALFSNCLSMLDSGEYRQRVRDTYREKWGRASPFVHWESISETLLEQALACVPANHLKYCFERMLIDLKANRAGLPDLIQLWPRQRRYRWIEVKGPGDRLQDNQRRWLAFFQQHDIPATVCHVTWEADSG